MAAVNASAVELGYFHCLGALYLLSNYVSSVYMFDAVGRLVLLRLADQQVRVRYYLQLRFS
jgi:hypothetical protein